MNWMPGVRLTTAARKLLAPLPTSLASWLCAARKRHAPRLPATSEPLPSAVAALPHLQKARPIRLLISARQILSRPRLEFPSFHFDLPAAMLHLARVDCC